MQGEVKNDVATAEKSSFFYAGVANWTVVCHAKFVVVYFEEQRDGEDFITTKGQHIMNDTDKGAQSKTTATEQHKATTDQAKVFGETKASESIKLDASPLNAQSGASVNSRTKMDIATEVYKRMKRTKGVTRKEIIEQFVAEAKISKAGASTYYQLIKAKVK